MGMARLHAAETRVNTVQANAQSPYVCALKSGDFIIAWTSLYEDGDQTSVWARQYNINGGAVTNPFKVNNAVVGIQQVPSIASLNGLVPFFYLYVLP